MSNLTLTDLFHTGLVAQCIWAYLPITDALRAARTNRQSRDSFGRALTQLLLPHPIASESVLALMRYKPPLTHVSIPDLDDVAVLEAVPPARITHLSLARARGLAGGGCGLRRFRRLRCLDVSGSDLAELSPFSGLSLTDLSLAGTRITALAQIESSLATLQTLDLSGTRVVDLPLLRYAGRLRRLTMIGCQIGDTLPMLPDGVTHLDLSSSSVRQLDTLPAGSLRELSLSGCRIDDLAQLARCRLLTFLDVSGVNVADIRTVTLAAPGLQFLDISRTPIEDLGPISKCVMLRGLRAAHTRIGQVGPLSYCPQLELLDISYTGVRDVRPLVLCPNLRYVNVAQTPISNMKWIESIARLE